MATGPLNPTRRVLIVSSHPLFSEGLRRILQSRSAADANVVAVTCCVDDALKAIEDLSPDLVIVDYDDEEVNREEFLVKFVEGERQLRVVLLSLKEGGSEAIVYDRRTLAASQVDDWFSDGQNIVTGE
jgi:DNA-binding NarL/FixJ family response regulator